MSGIIFLGARLLMGPRPGPQASVNRAEADSTRAERMFMMEVRMRNISSGHLSGHLGTFLDISCPTPSLLSHNVTLGTSLAAGAERDI